MEELNTVNEVQEAVVEPQTPEEATNEVTEPAEGTPEAAEEGAAVKPPQTPEENRRQAQMRRSRENDLLQQLRAAEAKNQESAQQYDRLLGALKGFGYEGDAEAVTEAILAQQRGVTVEQVRAQQAEERQRLQEMVRRDPEYQRARQLAEAYEQLLMQQVRDRDLAEINKAYPEAKIRDIEELGEDFRALREAGVGNLAAYAAVRGAQAAVQKPVPPEVGAVNSTQTKDNEYYTNEELDALTAKQLENPKVLAKARRSMEVLFGKRKE